ENADAVPLGERAVQRADVSLEDDGEHVSGARGGVETVAGRLTGHRHLHVQRAGRLGLADPPGAPHARAVPVPVAELADIAVPAVLAQDGPGGGRGQHRADCIDAPTKFVFGLRQRGLVDGPRYYSVGVANFRSSGSGPAAAPPQEGVVTD